jgi:outer membrane receptor protein involved in Fe transport
MKVLRLAIVGATLLPTAEAAAQAPSPPAAPSATETIVVTAKRLNAARSRIQPGLGATVTNFSAQTLAKIPQASNAPLSAVLLQAPGVAQDSFGQIHVRGDHNEVQYRLDGVELPEGLSVFGQALESRFANSISFITGALPAQYGQLQAAVVDITTKSGATDPGGEISLYGGARDYLEPSLSYGAAAGKWDWFVIGDVLHSRVGIENPTTSFNPDHDLSNQYHALTHIDYTIDADTRLSFIGGISNEDFQIPNNPGQVPSLGLSVDGISTANSAALTEHQREITDFTILSLQQHFSGFDIQTSLFSRYSSLYFSPDEVPDILFTGIAQTAGRSVWSSGAQSDASWFVDDTHTIRFGLQATAERTVFRTVSNVLPLNDAGQQTSQSPETLIDGSGHTGGIYGAYLQDEWKLAKGLTLNFGGRFDLVDEFTHENQLSPRTNLVWQATKNLTFHAGYAHYFTPPPFELVGGNTVALFNNTSAAATVTKDSTVRAEHDNYFDLGAEQVFGNGIRLGLDGYYKSARQLIDEGQFGAPIILSAFNYAKGQVHGVESSASYDHGPWSLYANFAVSRAVGKDIDTAQFNFQPAELAYISNHWIYLDHNETYAGSGGAAYTAFYGTDHAARLSADLQTGSGLRASTATIPNGQALPGYYVINLAASQSLGHGLRIRLDILNLLDRKYEIRNGTGVGVGAPQFGLRRTILAGISKTF